jgi:hypothetical protein
MDAKRTFPWATDGARRISGKGAENKEPPQILRALGASTPIYPPNQSTAPNTQERKIPSRPQIQLLEVRACGLLCLPLWHVLLGSGEFGLPTSVALRLVLIIQAP